MWGWSTGIGTGAPSRMPPHGPPKRKPCAPRNAGFKKENPLTKNGADVAPIYRATKPDPARWRGVKSITYAGDLQIFLPAGLAQNSFSNRCICIRLSATSLSTLDTFR